MNTPVAPTQSVQGSPTVAQLSFATKVCFGIGNFPIIISKLAPKQLSLPIYNDLLGINPGLIGGILAVARILDAATDTAMGHISDHTRSRWGRRRPYIFSGAFLTALFFASIWMFPDGLSSAAYVAWFIVTSTLFYLALTVFSVPWYALGYELPQNYDERTRLQAYANFFAPLGQIVVAWFYPLTQLAVFGSPANGVRVMGVVAGMVLLVFGLIPAIFVKEPGGEAVGRQVKKKATSSFWDGARAAAKCAPFVRLTVAFTLILIGVSFGHSLTFYLVTYFLFGGDRAAAAPLIGWAFTVSCLSSMLLTPLAAKLSVRFGKKEIFLVALGYGILRSLILWFLLDPAHPWLLLVNSLLAGFDGAAIFMLCHAMISDICDLDELQSGQRREGLFGALYGWVYKTGNALSLFGVGSMLVAIGFKSASAGAAMVQSAQTLLLLKICYCLIPVTAFAAGLLIMRKYEISRAMAEGVRAQLDARKA